MGAKPLEVAFFGLTLVHRKFFTFGQQYLHVLVEALAQADLLPISLDFSAGQAHQVVEEAHDFWVIILAFLVVEGDLALKQEVAPFHHYPEQC